MLAVCQDIAPYAAYTLLVDRYSYSADNNGEVTDYHADLNKPQEERRAIGFSARIAEITAGILGEFYEDAR